jgi:hypothetical protein
MADTDTTNDALREQVRERYAAAARAVSVAGSGTPAADEAGCCAPGPVEVQFGSGLYRTVDRDELPDAAVMASLGCGNPIAVVELAPGETVLDLGSGGGIDVILSA